MKMIPLKDINQLRNAGWRPQVVGCFLFDKKILFVYKKKHDLWQLPQGGIDNDETLEQAFQREMTEELSNDFIKTGGQKIELIGEAKVEFPLVTKGSRELKNDLGQPILMKGKKYFFIATRVSALGFDIKKTEFDDFQWLNYHQANLLASKIYQKGKKRITLYALKLLNQLDLL